MPEITLPRTGRRPVTFTGELLAEVETQGNNSAYANYSGSSGHGYRVRIYRTLAGRYVVAVTHVSSWSGDDPVTHDVEQFESLATLAAWVEHDAPLPLRAKDELVTALDIAPGSID